MLCNFIIRAIVVDFVLVMGCTDATKGHSFDWYSRRVRAVRYALWLLLFPIIGFTPAGLLL